MPAEVRRRLRLKQGTEFEVTTNEQGQVIVPPLGAVYAELQAGPGVTTDLLDRFLSATGIEADWLLGEGIWRAAGAAAAAYVVGRTSSGADVPGGCLQTS